MELKQSTASLALIYWRGCILSADLRYFMVMIVGIAME